MVFLNLGDFLRFCIETDDGIFFSPSAFFPLAAEITLIVVKKKLEMDMMDILTQCITWSLLFPVFLGGL